MWQVESGKSAMNKITEILYNLANFYSKREFTLDGVDYAGVEQAEADIIQLFELVVGKDEPNRKEYRKVKAVLSEEGENFKKFKLIDNGTGSVPDDDSYLRNKLRAEQRQMIKRFKEGL